MNAFNPELMARAALVRIDHGDDLTWPLVEQRIKGYADGLTKPQLEQVVGFLAASILQPSKRDGAA